MCSWHSVFVFVELLKPCDLNNYCKDLPEAYICFAYSPENKTRIRTSRWRHYDDNGTGTCSIHTAAVHATSLQKLALLIASTCIQKKTFITIMKHLRWAGTALVHILRLLVIEPFQNPIYYGGIHAPRLQCTSSVSVLFSLTMWLKSRLTTKRNAPLNAAEYCRQKLIYAYLQKC